MDTSISQGEESIVLSDKSVITIDLVEANVETNIIRESPSIDPEVNMILESITTLPPVEREVVEIPKSPTIPIENSRRRIGKKPLTQEQLQQQHYRNLQETTVIAVPTLPMAVEQDRTLEDHRDRLLENYPYREGFGPGWGSEPTPGDISRQEFRRIYDYDGKFPKKTQTNNNNRRNDRENESRNIGSSSRSPVYNKEYYDARERARSIFPTKRDRSRSPVRNVSTRNNRTLDSSRDNSRSRNTFNSKMQKSVDMYRMGESRYNASEANRRNNNLASNSNMNMPRDRSLSEVNKPTRESKREADGVIETVLHRLDDVENNVIGLIQVIMNDIATRSRAEPQPAPINRVESSANTSEGIADRSMFNILRLSNLETAVNNRGAEGGDSSIPNRRNSSTQCVGSRISDARRANMMRYSYLLTRIRDAEAHGEDITSLEHEINTIPWSDRMELHFGGDGGNRSDSKSPEDPSAMMATFELEIVTDNLWLKLNKIIVVAIMLFVIELVLPTQWSKILVRIVSTVTVICLSQGIINTRRKEDKDATRRLKMINEMSCISPEVAEFIVPNLTSNEDIATTSHAHSLLSNERTELMANMDESNIDDSSSSSTTKEFRPRTLTYEAKGVSKRKTATFIMDSGCTKHVVNDSSILYDLTNKHASKEMGRITGCVGGSSVRVTGYGMLQPLGRVLIAPFISNNIISVSQLALNGFQVTFDATRCRATKTSTEGEIIIEGTKINGHYICKLEVRQDTDPKNER